MTKPLTSLQRLSLLALVLTLIFLSLPSWTIDIRASGSWALILDLTDMQGPAGSELIPEHESVADESGIRVSKAKEKYWSVDIRKQDIHWHGDLQFFLRRTSDGTGKGWIAGGLIYTEATDTDSQFFTGYHDRDKIDIQFKLTGVSTNLSSDIYTADIIYTVTETQ